jgi:hypothetical protein
MESMDRRSENRRIHLASKNLLNEDQRKERKLDDSAWGKATYRLHPDHIRCGTDSLGRVGRIDGHYSVGRASWCFICRERFLAVETKHAAAAQKNGL